MVKCGIMACSTDTPDEIAGDAITRLYFLDSTSTLFKKSFTFFDVLFLELTNIHLKFSLNSAWIASALATDSTANQTLPPFINSTCTRLSNVSSSYKKHFFSRWLFGICSTMVKTSSGRACSKKSIVVWSIDASAATIISEWFTRSFKPI